MTHRIGTKGQVVIPKAIREQLGIRPGDEVTFEPDGAEVRVRRATDEQSKRLDALRSLRGSWSGNGAGTRELLEERRAERRLEQSRARRHGVAGS